MFWKAVTLLGLALCSLGEQHATSEQIVKQEFVPGHHGELNHIGSHSPEHHEEYAWAYPSYEFSYTVNDPHTHDYKGQYEHRKGDEVKGEYWLLQPDGKKRTVKYEADKHKGFRADVHYSEHHHYHRLPRIEEVGLEEPQIEEILKPVVEVVQEEAPRPILESEPILVEEIPEAIVEEPKEERIEPIRQTPKHKPIHIEYYINHKYQKHHQEEPEGERRQEESSETGQEARIQEEHEPRPEVKYRKPVHVERYSRIHHPVHNEYHGHEIPRQRVPTSIIVHHDDREERAWREHQRIRQEQREREERREREEQIEKEKQKEREEQREREKQKEIEELREREEREREEQREREEKREREEQREREAKREREEQREREAKREREEQLEREAKREREEQREREEKRAREEKRREEGRGRKEERGREELRRREEEPRGWREHRGREENHTPSLPLWRPVYRSRYEQDEREENKPIHTKRINEPQERLLQLHKPVIRPEHGHYRRSTRP